jgi:hypothetical protein
MMKRTIKSSVRFVQKNLEALLWLSGLGYLAVINPYSGGHLSLCAFDLAGIDFCPGCGLGMSISLLFHGDVASSFTAHPLGIIAFIIILYRIISLLFRNFSNSNRSMEVYNG